MSSLQPDQDIARLLALSDERDQWLRRLDADYQTGIDIGISIGIEIGRRQVLAEEAAAQRAAARHLLRAGQVEGDRWKVRRQRRDRASFGKPHKGDRPGRDAA